MIFDFGGGNGFGGGGGFRRQRRPGTLFGNSPMGPGMDPNQAPSPQNTPAQAYSYGSYQNPVQNAYQLNGAYQNPMGMAGGAPAAPMPQPPEVTGITQRMPRPKPMQQPQQQPMSAAQTGITQRSGMQPQKPRLYR